jgi:hypothetical protein
MRTFILLAAIAVVTLPTFSTTASAQRVLCRERAEIVKILASRFDETQRVFGLQGNGRVFELFAASDGSWTALITTPAGRSCIVASGEAFTIVPPEPVGEPA